MIWYILILLFCLLLVWMLLGPVIIFLDTGSNQYRISLPGVVTLMVVANGDQILIRGWIFFVPFKFDPFKKRKQTKKKDPARTVTKKSKKRSASIRMFRKVVAAFRIRKLLLDIDTDDVLLNAWLVPAFSMVNSAQIQMQVNFEGTAYLHLDLRTRIGAILWILFKNR